MSVTVNPDLVNPTLAHLKQVGVNSKGMAVAGRIASIAQTGFSSNDYWGDDATSIDVEKLYKNAAEKITRRPNAHILLFLESRFAAAAYKVLLEKQGFRVTMTCGPDGGRRALSTLLHGNSAFDAVLLEWETGGYGGDDLRGRDIVTLYNQARPEMPIVAVALTSSNYPPSLAIRGGADLFLRLPLMLHLPTLRRLLLPNASGALAFPAAALSSPAQFKRISEKIGSLSVNASRRQEEEIQSLVQDFNKRATESSTMLTEVEVDQLLNNIAKLVAPTGKFKVHMEERGDTAGQSDSDKSDSDDDKNSNLEDDDDDDDDEANTNENDLDGEKRSSTKNNNKKKKKKKKKHHRHHGPKYEIDFSFLKNIVASAKSMKSRFEEVSRENQVLRRFVRKLLDITPRPVDVTEIPGRKRRVGAEGDISAGDDDDADHQQLEEEDEQELLEQIKAEQSIKKWVKGSESAAASNQLPISVLATLARYSNEVEEEYQVKQIQRQAAAGGGGGGNSLFAKQQMQLEEVSAAKMESWPRSKLVDYIVKIQDRMFRAQADLDQLQSAFHSMKNLENCVEAVAGHISSLNQAKADAALQNSFAAVVRGGGGGEGSKSTTPRATALTPALGTPQQNPLQSNIIAAAVARKKRRREWVQAGGRTVTEMLEEQLMLAEDSAAQLLARTGANRSGPALFRHRWKVDRAMVQPTYLPAFDAIVSLADSICTILNDAAIRVCVKFPPAHSKFDDAAKSFRHLADSVRWEHILVQRDSSNAPSGENSGSFDESDSPFAKRGQSFQKAAKQLQEDARRQREKGTARGAVVSALDVAHRRKVMLVRAMRLCALIRTRVTQSFTMEMWGRWAAEHREVRRETDQVKLRRERELLRAESMRMKNNLELAAKKLSAIRMSRESRGADRSKRAGADQRQHAEHEEHQEEEAPLTMEEELRMLKEQRAQDIADFERMLSEVTANVSMVNRLAAGKETAVAESGAGRETPRAVSPSSPPPPGCSTEALPTAAAAAAAAEGARTGGGGDGRRHSKNQQQRANSKNSPVAGKKVTSPKPSRNQQPQNSHHHAADGEEEEDASHQQQQRRPRRAHASGFFGQTAASKSKRHSMIAPVGVLSPAQHQEQQQRKGDGKSGPVNSRNVQMPQVAPVTIADRHNVLKVAEREQQQQQHAVEASEPPPPPHSDRRGTVVGVDHSKNDDDGHDGGVFSDATFGEQVHSLEASGAFSHQEQAPPPVSFAEVVEHDGNAGSAQQRHDQQQQQQQQQNHKVDKELAAETRRRVAQFQKAKGDKKDDFGENVKGGAWSTAPTTTVPPLRRASPNARRGSDAAHMPPIAANTARDTEQQQQQSRRGLSRSRSRSPTAAASGAGGDAAAETAEKHEPERGKKLLSVIDRLYQTSPSPRQLERRKKLEEEQQRKLMIVAQQQQRQQEQHAEQHSAEYGGHVLHQHEFNPLRSPLQHHDAHAQFAAQQSMMSPRLAAMLGHQSASSHHHHHHQQQQHAGAGGLVGSGFAQSSRTGASAPQVMLQGNPRMQHQQHQLPLPPIQSQSARSPMPPSPQQQQPNLPSPPAAMSHSSRVAVKPRQFFPRQ